MVPERLCLGCFQSNPGHDPQYGIWGMVDLQHLSAMQPVISQSWKAFWVLMLKKENDKANQRYICFEENLTSSLAPGLRKREGRNWENPQWHILAWSFKQKRERVTLYAWYILLWRPTGRILPNCICSEANYLPQGLTACPESSVPWLSRRDAVCVWSLQSTGNMLLRNLPCPLFPTFFVKLFPPSVFPIQKQMSLAEDGNHLSPKLLC